MKTVTKICICLLVALSILLIPSCAREESLVAYATDYVGEIKFTSGEFDIDKIIAMRRSTSPYFNYTCYVSKNEGYDKREDRLIVSNEWSETIKTIIAGSGWFVGVDYSEFLSGIMYYPSTNGREFGGMEPKMVLGENCVGLFEINNELYAVTCYNSCTEAPTNVSLYRLIYPTKENGLKCYAEKITEIPDVNFANAATATDDGLNNCLRILLSFIIPFRKDERTLKIFDLYQTALLCLCSLLLQTAYLRKRVLRRFLTP